MSKLVIISGATATGKSELAIEVAKEIGAEIISADSMQLYKGMDIGTAKLTMAERQGITHHLLDLVDVKTDVTVSWYQELARAKIDELRGAGKSVVVVGGTGLYIKAILDDLNFPETDPEVRMKLNQEAEKIGGDAMHQKLAKLDPAASLAIPKENVRRVIRALEVIEITGKPFTAILPREDSTKYPDAMQFGLAMDRESLDIRIDNRVAKMWEAGFVDEVEELILTLSKEGNSTAVIGTILRDRYAVPDARLVTGERISQTLARNNIVPSYPEDMMNLMRKALSLIDHLNSNKKDLHNRRQLELCESRIRRLAKYYIGTGRLSSTWAYKRDQLRLMVE